MDGQYAAPMQSMASFYATGYPLMTLPDTSLPRLHQPHTQTVEGLGRRVSYDDLAQTMLPAQGPSRARRRQTPGLEHVKHRRTRSGCYTCRQRRVKCDEAQPICERCRKGKRECAYPGTVASSSKSSTAGSKVKDSSDSPSSSASEIDEDENSALTAIIDVEEDGDPVEDDEPFTASSETPVQPGLSSTLRNQKVYPSISRAGRTNARHLTPSILSKSSRWAALPSDVKFYLRYHHESLSHHHYAFKYDGSDFLKTTYLEIALNDPSAALLYAIVSFAAYHYALTSTGKKIYPFLAYYNRSITCLQQSLLNKRHSVATILTILQLATIEEFLGDWVNLVGHQRAAHQILTNLFTPQTIMQDETRRKIIVWYIRFDIFASFMSGGGISIGREWFVVCADFYTQQTADKPDDLGAQFEAYIATSRLLATDATALFAAMKGGSIGYAQFMEELTRLARGFHEFETQIQTAFTDSSSFVKDFSHTVPANEDDIVDYRDPNFLYAGELSTMNFVLLDFWGIYLMFKYQLAMVQQQAPSSELLELALKQCKMFEAVQYADQGPPGGVLGCQASLGLCTMVLPKDQKHIMWCRRKLALVEQLGYIYPSTFRKRMSETWQEDVTHWWLPNDEGYPDIVRTIREFIEYRATVPTDPSSTRLRDISGIFQSMNLDEQAVIGGSRSDDIGSDRDASHGSGSV